MMNNTYNNTSDILVCDKLICSGCGACSIVCPTNCIEMSNNSEGFYYPTINASQCVNCNKCRNNCPSINSSRQGQSSPDVYAFVNKNKNVIKASSSGGAFTAFSEYIIRNGGVVFSCVFDSKFNAIFDRAESIEELAKMRGSKYVESKAWIVYADVKEELANEKLVLFVGLPCQVAGLLSTLSEEYKKTLITIDLLCHGVPSHGLFEAYIEMVTAQKGQIIDYSFREKKYWGWGNWGRYNYKKGDRIKEKKTLVANDYYYSLYFKENNYRESCYTCSFAKLPRISDITIGDCWNEGELAPMIDNIDGVSLILLNTDVGRRLYDEIKDDNQSFLVPLEKAINNNGTISNPTTRPQERDSFYKDVNELGFEKAAQKYTHLKYVFPVVARYIPKGIKKKIKKLIKR